MAEKEKDTVMSKIQPYLDIIKNEPSGESVRDAIINCMKIINADSMIETLHKEITVTDATLPFSRSYTAGDGKAWHQVTINLSADTEASSTMTFAEFEVNDDTVNGTYTPENMGLAANTYWNKINVNVLRRYEGVGDVAIIEDCLYDEELGMSYWEAEPHGYNPVSKVYFTNEYQLPVTPQDPINPTNKTYTVNFYSESGTLIQQVNDISYGDDASYYFTGEIPSKDGYHFLRWKPDVSYVTHNIKAYPEFVKAESGPSSAPYENWEELCADRGAKAAIGSTMAYDLTSTKMVPETVLTCDAINCYGAKITLTVPQTSIGTLGALNFMKVDDATAGNGSVSTWLSTTPLRIGFDLGNIPKIFVTLTNRGANIGEDIPSYISDWRQAILNKFLNEYVFNLLDSSMKATIKNVPKVQYGIANVNLTPAELKFAATSTQESGMCKLWIPSFCEISSFITEDMVPLSKFDSGIWETNDDNLNKPELGGRIYEAWRPNVRQNLSSMPFLTRTCKTAHPLPNAATLEGKYPMLFNVPLITPEPGSGSEGKEFDFENLTVDIPNPYNMSESGTIMYSGSYIALHSAYTDWSSGIYIGFCL